MRVCQMSSLTVLVAVLLGSPLSVRAQLSAGGLATGPAAPAAPGGASAAAAPLTAQGIAGSITGSSLGTVSTGNVDISTAGQAAGTVFKPPRTPAKITVPKAPPPPKAPTATGPLATCTFNVAGNAPASLTTVVSTISNAQAEGTASITCTGAGAPIKLYGTGRSSASFTSKLAGVNFLTNTFGGPQPVLQFVDLNIRIENSIFRNLQGTPYTIIFNNSNVEFVNTVFSGNTGTPEGVIHGFGSAFNFTGCNFTTNHGRQTGAITIEDGTAQFTSCIFDGNKGDQANSGAVVIGAGSYGTFTQTKMIDNEGNAAGAVLAYKGTTLTIDRSTFSGNQAANNGGAIQHLGGAISIGNSSFGENTAASIGGAYFGADVTGIIGDSDFLNNTASTGQGGAVYLQVGLVDVVNCRFSGNIGQAGGGLFQQEVQGLVDQCAFEDNTATNSGAGVSQSGGSGNVTNCIFINNQAVNLGAGLYQSNRTGGVDSAIFADNSATQAFSGQGAGIFRNGMNGDVTNIFFEGNDAALNGGGLYMIASIGDVNTCTFLTNLATTGPAVYAFNCAGRINTNAFANQPVDAVAIDHSIGFTEKSLTTGTLTIPGAALAPGASAGAPGAAAAAGPDPSGLSGLR